MGLRLRSPYDREIRRLAVPAFATLIAEPLYVLVDTAVVGHLGTTQLAGLAIASSALLLTHAFFIFLAYGTTGTVARMLGAGRPADAARLTVGSVWVAVVAGIVTGALLAGFADPIVGALGAEGETAAYAKVYLQVSALGVPFLLIALAGVGYLRGTQDTRTPLVVTGVSAALNLVLELVLIYGLDRGIGASAAATVFAQGCAAGAYLIAIHRAVTAEGVGWRPDLAAIRSVLGSGAAALVFRTAVLRGSITASTAVAARIGTADVAAHQIAIEVWAFLALALDAIAIAGQALTGRLLGAGDVSAARGAGRRMIELGIGAGCALGVGLLAASRILPSVFTDDAVVGSLAAFLLVQVALQQPLNGLVFTLDGILIGAGDLGWLAGGMGVSAAVFAAAALIVVWSDAGIGWVWGAVWALMITRAITLVGRFRSERWLVTGG